MPCILLTGMSGTGKSTAIAELRARGYTAADMDEPGWSLYSPDGEWVWQEDRVRDFLAQPHEDVRFISGCARNQVQFYPQFSAIILMSAPADVLIHRLKTRTNNPYGQHPDDQAATLENLATVEPLLRRSATHEIDTRTPLDSVVARILQIAAQ